MALLLSSCSTQKQDDDIIFFDRIESKDFTAFFSEKDLTIIPLETTPKALIGEMSLIKTSNSEYFLFSEQDGRVHRFSKTGDFINSIGETGHGPGEYQQPLGFSINGDSIVILTVNGSESALHYFSKNGEYFRSSTFENHAYSSFEISGDKYFFSTGSNLAFGNKHKIHIRDEKGKLINELMKIEPRNLYAMSENNFHKEGEDIFFWESFNNTTFKFDSTSFSSTNTLDFDDYNLNEKLLEGDDPLENFYAVLDNGIGLIKTYFESEQIGYINIMTQQTERGAKFWHLFVNKSDDQLHLVNTSNARMAPFGLTSNNEMLFLMYPGDLIEFSRRNPDFFNEKLKQIEGLNMEDNPIVIIAKINL